MKSAVRLFTAFCFLILGQAHSQEISLERREEQIFKMAVALEKVIGERYGINLGRPQVSAQTHTKGSFLVDACFDYKVTHLDALPPSVTKKSSNPLETTNSSYPLYRLETDSILMRLFIMKGWPGVSRTKSTFLPPKESFVNFGYHLEAGSNYGKELNLLIETLLAGFMHKETKGLLSKDPVEFFRMD
jgi:hypothetical protein